MTKELLDDPQVGAALQQMSRRAVPQPVRTEIRSILDVLQQRVDSAANLPLVNPSPPASEEQRRPASFRGELWATNRAPLLNGFPRRHPVWDGPLLVPLADDSHDLTLVIDIVSVECSELAHPDAGRIQQLEHGSVPNMDRVLVITGDGSDLEQLPGILGGQHIRQRRATLGSNEAQTRILGEPT